MSKKLDVTWEFRFEDNLASITPDEILEPIGRANLYWTQLDNHIDQALWHLMGLSPENGLNVTVEIRRFESKIDLLLAFTQEKLPGAATKTLETKIIPLIRDANKQRNNKIAHGMLVNVKNITRQTSYHALIPLRDRNKPNASVQHMATPKSVNNIANKIDRANKEFVKFVRDFIIPRA